ncbi:response regulator [Pedobacter sp. HMF7647]|uniref:Response regulator n=1 Tax=Hufsiella arboris TaxID=2695275 RepID=A0A7K1Y5U6_9SPHI|nr:response regulator transcription factor [Hufsiella arboris]MXV49810.1 response regulator [Hufsiella arboris]
MSITKIALVDDHRLFRSGIATLLSNFERYQVILEASNGLDFSDHLDPENKPDVVLLDINMPIMDGFETADWLKKNHPKIKIIILSMFEDSDKVIRLLKSGIKGYLLKDSDPREFKQALDHVSSGDVYYPDFVTKRLVNNLQEPNDRISLTEREIEFLELAGTDLSYKEIAEEMCVSNRTIDGYRDQLFEKFGVKTRVALVLHAVKFNFIQL